MEQTLKTKQQAHLKALENKTKEYEDFCESLRGRVASGEISDPSLSDFIRYNVPEPLDTNKQFKCVLMYENHTFADVPVKCLENGTFKSVVSDLLDRRNDYYGMIGFHYGKHSLRIQIHFNGKEKLEESLNELNDQLVRLNNAGYISISKEVLEEMILTASDRRTANFFKVGEE